jgi:hypothetical protein
MAQKQRKGIDLMKKVSDKQAADRRLLMADNDRRLKRLQKRPAM